MRHNAIVVTSWHEPSISAALLEANYLGLTVIGPSKPMINGIISFMICPDGSKEGWAESNEFDEKREYYVKKLRNLGYLSWVSVAYSGDSETAEILDHTWKGEQRRDY